MRHGRIVTVAFLFLVFCLLVALFLTACGGADAETEADGKLLVLEWSGYEATEYPQFFVPFTEKYADNLDEVIEYSFYADDAESLAKMQSGVGADITHPCNSWWQLYVDNGLVQEIDTSRLSNWDQIHPDLAAMG